MLFLHRLHCARQLQLFLPASCIAGGFHLNLVYLRSRYPIQFLMHHAPVWLAKSLQQVQPLQMEFAQHR